MHKKPKRRNRGKVTLATIKILTDALESDQIRKLLMNRVSCSPKLAKHKHILVRDESLGVPKYSISMLGIINGILSSLDEPLIGHRIDITLNQPIEFVIVEK